MKLHTFIIPYFHRSNELKEVVYQLSIRRMYKIYFYHDQLTNHHYKNAYNVYKNLNILKILLKFYFLLNLRP